MPLSERRALVYALGEAASVGWGSAQIISSLAVAAVTPTVFVARQIGHTDRLLPLRVVLDRNRGWAMTGLIVNGVSTYGMMLILTYQLQSVMGYSALQTGLALIPFALAALPVAALLAPWLMTRVPPRWLITAAIAAEAAGLAPLIWLTPHSGYLPLVGRYRLPPPQPGFVGDTPRAPCLCRGQRRLARMSFIRR